MQLIQDAHQCFIVMLVVVVMSTSLHSCSGEAKPVLLHDKGLRSGSMLEAASSSSPATTAPGISSTIVNGTTWPPTSGMFDSIRFYQPMQARSNFFGGCDEDTGTCFVFGGIGPTGVAVSDLSVRFNTWDDPLAIFRPFAAAAENSPSPRSGGQSLSYHPQEGSSSSSFNVSVFILYGGTLFDRSISSEAYSLTCHTLSDTCQWQRMMPTVTNQVPMTRFSAVYSRISIWDELYNIRHALFLFGIQGSRGISNAVYFVEIDSAAIIGGFSQLRIDHSDAVSPRTDSCCVSSLVENVTMCFGGFDGKRALGDTLRLPLQNVVEDSWAWEITQTSNATIRGSSTVVSIPARFGAQCAYHRENDVALMFGGMSNLGSVVDDVAMYAYDFARGTWSIVGYIDPTVMPTAGFGLMSVYSFTNSTGDVVVDDDGSGNNTVLLAGGITAVARTSQVTVLQHSSSWWSSSLSNNNSNSNKSNQLLSATILSSNQLSPETRRYHNVNAVGNITIVAFGVNAVPLDTVYAYVGGSSSTSNSSSSSSGKRTWHIVTASESSTESPSPRFGACSCVVGSTVYYFGGFTDSAKTQLSNQLWALLISNTSSSSSSSSSSSIMVGTWRLVGSDTLNGGRAWHTCFFYDHYLFFIGGVVGSATGYSSSVVSFDIRLQTFSMLSVAPSSLAISLLARAGAMLYFNGTHAHIYGGVRRTSIGEDVVSDLVIFTPNTLSSTTTTATVSLMTPTQKIQASAMPRAFGGVVGTGSNMLICGGVTAVTTELDFAASAGEECFMIYLPTAAQGLFSASTESLKTWYSTGGVGLAGVFQQSSAVFFGGSLVVGEIASTSGCSGSLVEYNILPLCSKDTNNSISTAAATLTQCWSCPPGSNADADCSLVRAGSYSFFPGSTTMCPAGRASSLSGATTVDSCVLCPQGTYSPSPGASQCMSCPPASYCPVGSTTPLASPPQNSVSLNEQPAKMSDGEVPSSLYAIAGCVVGGVIFLLFVLVCIGCEARKRRRERYFTSTWLRRIRSVYDRNKRNYFGVDVEGFERCLNELGIRRGAIHRELLSRVLTENDGHGCGHLTMAALIDAIASLIDQHIISPLPETEQAYLGPPVYGVVHRLFLGFNFKMFDAYANVHALTVDGDAIRSLTTTAGGVTRWAFFVISIFAVLVIIGQFVYVNIVESRASIPSVAYDSAFSARTLQFRLEAIGVPSGFQEDCTTIKMSGVTSASDVFSTVTQSNSYEHERCVIVVTCKYCELDFDSQYTLNVTFGGEMYATSLSLTISSSTGIETAASVVSMEVIPYPSTSSSAPSSSAPSSLTTTSNDGVGTQVFRGRPETVFTVSLLPVMFRTVDNVFTQNSMSTTGFQAKVKGATPGNTVDYASMSQYRSVPIVLDISVDSNAVDVARLPTSTVFDLISSILGTLSGLGGACIIVLGYYDYYLVQRRYARRQRELEADAKEHACTFSLHHQQQEMMSIGDNDEDDDELSFDKDIVVGEKGMMMGSNSSPAQRRSLGFRFPVPGNQQEQGGSDTAQEEEHHTSRPFEIL